MLSTIKTITILILPFTIGLTEAYEKQEIKSEWSKEVELPKKIIYVESSNYPSCAIIDRDNTDSSKLNASVQTFKDGNVKYSCNIPIEHSEDIPGYLFHLLTLENDIEVLSYDQYENTSTTAILFIIDMKTCQFTKEVVTRENEFNMLNFRYTTPYKDCIDVFFANVKEFNNSPCKLRYNITTKEWSEPIGYPALGNVTNMQMISSVHHVANGNNYLFIVDNAQNQVVASVDSTTDKTKWLDIDGEPSFSINDTNDINTDHQAIGNCHTIPDNKITCKRTDLDLNPTLDVKLDAANDTDYVGTHNTKDGGMLLFTCHCAKEVDYSCKEYEIDMTKINADATHEEPKELTKLSCSPSSRPSSMCFEEDGNTCVRFMCFSGYFTDKLHYHTFVRCF